MKSRLLTTITLAAASFSAVWAQTDSVATIRPVNSVNKKAEALPIYQA